MYLVRKHTKENDNEVITPLFVTDKEYAERYVKEQNKIIKMFQDVAKKIEKYTITEGEMVYTMNAQSAVCDFILKKEDLYNYILVDAIEIPFYEGKFNEKIFVPNSAKRALSIKLRENTLDDQEDHE